MAHKIETFGTLRGADLRETYLSGADLRGADLRGADLSSKCYIGAALHGCALDANTPVVADLSPCWRPIQRAVEWLKSRK